MIPFFSLCMIHFLPIFAPDKTVKSPRSKKRIHRVLNIDTIIDTKSIIQQGHRTRFFPHDPMKIYPLKTAYSYRIGHIFILSPTVRCACFDLFSQTKIQITASWQPSAWRFWPVTRRLQARSFARSRRRTAVSRRKPCLQGRSLHGC